MNPTKTLDTTGLLCPLPILKAKKELNALSPGDILCVIADDPTSVDDFKIFSKQTNHVLKETVEKNGYYQFFLEKA